MATTEAGPRQRARATSSRALLEVCSCDTLCPCWIGEDPDNGRDTVIAYNISTGKIRGVDVSGLTLVGVAHIPGNILEGNWREMVFVDDRASDEQMEAMVDCFGGSSAVRWRPGAARRRARLESSAQDRAHDRRRRAGTLTVGDKVDCAMQPYRARRQRHDAEQLDLLNGAGLAGLCREGHPQRVDIDEHGYQWELEGKNAIQSDWKIDYRGE